MSTSVALNLVEEQRYQVRKAFENGAPLQYKSKIHKDAAWATAYWCTWDWASYEYRIKPKETEKVEVLVPVYPYLINGNVVWHTEERVAHKQQMYPDIKFTRIIRFRNIRGVRNAVIEEEV